MACKSRARKLGWEATGGRTSIVSILTYNELFPNSLFQLYCPKDYYKQKQWNTLPVAIITEIMNFNRLLWWLPWHRRIVLVFGDLD